MEPHVWIPPGWKRSTLNPFTGLTLKGGPAAMARFVRKEHELEAVDRNFKLRQERRLRGHH